MGHVVELVKVLYELAIDIEGSGLMDEQQRVSQMPKTDKGLGLKYLSYCYTSEYTTSCMSHAQVHVTSHAPVSCAYAA